MPSIESPIELYAIQQRQRMESIRAATERERELLSERIATQQQGASSPANNYAYMPTDRSLAMKERDALRARAEQVGDLLAGIRQQEHQMASEEAEVDRRLHRATDRKRDLMSQLKSIQIREDELKNRETFADGKENLVKQRAEEVRVRQRDAQNQLATVKAEVSQREVLLVTTIKKCNDKTVEQQRALHRMRQQVADTETRVRTLEMQLNVRARAVDDLERETMRSEMELREDELHVIENLRRQIDDRKSALTVREVATSL
eukprot:GILI01033452.1.p1 GENE.GILI01033452.1~~GILI01033452.1.p1  ORF type:complete len:262 (-),score=33.05 GILI01033452.1:45-830(-)